MTRHNEQYAEVFPRSGRWIVRFTSEPLRSEVRSLFGTDEIISAFSTAMSFAEVAAALRAIPANAGTAFVEAGQ